MKFDILVDVDAFFYFFHGLFLCVIHIVDIRCGFNHIDVGTF